MNRLIWFYRHANREWKIVKLGHPSPRVGLTEIFTSYFIGTRDEQSSPSVVNSADWMWTNGDGHVESKAKLCLVYLG